MNEAKIKRVLDLHKKWLNNEQGGVKADLHGADLRGAYLCRADLREAALHGTDMRGANLFGADLRKADLRGADLRRANLYGADLNGANLRGADLRRADLNKANLRGTNLCEANLHWTDLRGANLCGANLDFSCLPLWCGVSKFQCDTKLVYQLLAHICTLEFDNTEGIKELIMPFAVKSHRAVDLGIGERLRLEEDK